jgi:hypothetical protein
MNRVPDNPNRRRHRREKATIDHLVDHVFDPSGQQPVQQSGTTADGASIEEQVRKEWDPRKDGGLPTFWRSSDTWPE